MDEAIPVVVELALDKVFDYVQIDNLPLAAGHVKRKVTQFFSGWHVTVSAALLLAACVLSVNIALLIWAIFRNLEPAGGDILVVFSGNCSEMNNVFTWSHVGINILSTLLLASSNSSCQVLSAPTRKEVDAAHARGVWLDVGVSSFRNLRYIAFKRVVVYALLALSSVPLHLIYNSVIFPTTSGSQSLVAWVGPGFLREPNFRHGLSNDLRKSLKRHPNEARTIQTLQEDAMHGRLEYLPNTQCVQQFSSQFISNYANFLIVMSNSTKASSSDGLIQFSTRSNGDSFNAVCFLNREYSCHPKTVQQNPDGWQMFRNRHQRDDILNVHHCLAQPVTPHCTVSMSKSLLIAVIICNFVKLCCFYIVVRFADDKPLVTLGDCIASFLKKEDLTTIGMGPVSAIDVRNGQWWKSSELKSHENSAPWRGKRHFWFSASGIKRCVVSFTCYFIILGAGAPLAWVAQQNGSLGGITGLGSVNTNRLVTATLSWGLTSNVLFVNLPQLIISIGYLFYNNVLTASLQALEFSEFADKRQTLRVTSNSKKQRSTYWLQIPYRYAIPFMVLWIVLHWLVSQSIFLARITTWKYQPAAEQIRDLAITACGYSAMAILLSVVLGSLLILTLILMGFRRYSAKAPLVGTCTAAIAAACHEPPPPDGRELAQEPLMYGVLRYYRGSLGLKRVGFSADAVDPLVPYEIYR